MNTSPSRISGGVVCCSIILLVGMTFASRWADANEQDRPIEPESPEGVLRQWIVLQEELRGHIDQSQLDEAALLDAQGFDASALYEFVRDQVRFEPYPGVLRGSLGTLLSQAGNSLDQSILLAKLVRDSGYDARIAQAQLSEEQATHLLNEMARKPPSPPILDDGAFPVLSRIGEFGASQGTGGEADDEAYDLKVAERQGQIESIGAALISSLERAGVSVAQRPIPAQMLNEVREYYWVQYREGPAAPWTDLHPAVQKAPGSFETLQSIQVFTETIPESLQQRVRIQLMGQRRVGERVEVVELTAPWERPVANMIGIPVVFKIVPSDFANSASEDYDPNASLFIPFLGESMAPAAMAFDLHGNIVPGSEAMSHMAGIFQTVSNKTFAAAAALQDVGAAQSDDSRPPMALEDVWLDISLFVPGLSQPRTWKRSFRSEGGNGPLTGSSVAKRVVFNAHPAQMSPARSYDDLLRLETEVLKLLLKQHRIAAARDSALDLKVLNSDLPVDHSVLDGIVEFNAFLDLYARPLENEITYRSEPLIVLKHQSIGPGEGDHVGMDIVHNERRSFLVDRNGGIKFAPTESLRSGVEEAMSESVIMGLNGENAINAIAASRTLLEGQTTFVLREESDIASLPSMDGAKSAAISRAVGHGRVVIMPAAGEGRDSGSAWWEVDPTTGVTLGRTANGWGGSVLVLSEVTVSDVALRKLMIGVICLMITEYSCHIYADTALAVISMVMTSGGWAACKAFFTIGPGGDMLHQGQDDPCDAIKQGGPFVIKAIKGLYKPIYQYCYKQLLPECLKAAAAAG